MKIYIMKVSSLILAALLTCQPGFAAEPLSNGVETAQWTGALKNVLGFFNRNAWDARSGSYASEISEVGTKTSENRDIVALGRMIYANAVAPGELQDLSRARLSAQFLLSNMMGRDSLGIYFKSVVSDSGAEVSSGRSYTFSFEQSYPITGLVALYAADSQNNSNLLPIIREAAQSYWNRFHDTVNGGLFYYYNFDKRDHSNDQGQSHKSYQSTIYPISSFLFALYRADPENRVIYAQWISELLQIATDRIVQFENGEPTGWLLERFTPNFNIDESYTMTEAGHISQLSWVLGVAVKEGLITHPSQRARYLGIAGNLFRNL